jgi:lipoyl(octanoyl) transferase
MHGFALNCNHGLEPYEAIVACGIRDATVSTITLLTGKEVTPLMAAERVEHYLTKIGEYVE